MFNNNCLYVSMTKLKNVNQYQFLEFPGTSCQQVNTRLQSGLLLQGFLPLLNHCATLQHQDVSLLHLLS